MGERGGKPPSRALRSAGNTLELAEHRDAHADQASGGKHAQKRVRHDHLEHVPHDRRQRADRTSDSAQATSHSLSLKPFLLSLKFWLRALESNQALQAQPLTCCLCTNPQYLKWGYKAIWGRPVLERAGRELRPSGAPLRYSRPRALPALAVAAPAGDEERETRNSALRAASPCALAHSAAQPLDPPHAGRAPAGGRGFLNVPAEG